MRDAHEEIALNMPGRPSAVAVTYGHGVWSIRTGGDTIGVAKEYGDGFEAWRLQKRLGVFDELAECAIAMMDAEDAELADRAKARGEPAPSPNDRSGA